MCCKSFKNSENSICQVDNVKKVIFCGFRLNEEKKIEPKSIRCSFNITVDKRWNKKNMLVVIIWGLNKLFFAKVLFLG